MVNILNMFLFKIIGHRLLVTILCVSVDCQEQFTDINQKMPTLSSRSMGPPLIVASCFILFGFSLLCV